MKAGAATVSAGVGAIGLIVGGLFGGYIQNLRVQSALEETHLHIAESKPIMAEFRENQSLDRVQQEQIDSLRRAVADLAVTNREIRDVLVRLAQRGGS